MLKFESITIEREAKLKTIFTNQTSAEAELFLLQLSQLNLTAPQQEQIREAVELNLKQNNVLPGLNRYYPAHPIRVARFITDWISPKSPNLVDTIIAALIHNTLEKKFFSSSVIERRFGKWIRNAIETLTLDREIHKTREGKIAYYINLSKADLEVGAIKFFDKFDNLFALCISPDEQVRREYLAEIRGFVRSLGNKIAPDLMPYFDDLIKDTENIGFYRSHFT